MRAFLLALVLASPTLAEPVPGADAPAFRAPFDRALQGDDPTALLDLHAAAEAGNTAALLALPAVSDWLRATLPFAERKKLIRINGLPIAEALAAADPVAALWAQGEPGSDMGALLQRAIALYDAGEPDKATLLFMTWLNQTGGYSDLPKDFFNHPVPPWAMAQVLRGRLIDNGVTLPADGDALIVDRLKADDPAAWIALAGFAGLDRTDAEPPDAARLAALFQAAGIPQDEAVRRMQAAVPALKVMRYEPVDAVTAKAATDLFRAEPEFQPLLSLCAATCPQTQDQCATAFVATFGHPYGRAARAQPPASVIPTSDFFATPRGRLVLLRSTLGRLGDDPATSPALAATREIDACLADAILAALP
ncbi:hypothetical protein [Rhodobacter sp. SY28-1]|uniref:hypothetical protein n=1 Tax=Rhodobacter sp. SY28-1 TaxID=2562317 RepID=UPI0010C12B38|nr:hypothetical protein [Rhodobacter sp. SY28-1]